MFKLNRVFFSIARSPKMELTIRTPYKTLVSKLSDFTRIVTKTNQAVLIVQNNMPPAMHVLPPGYLKVRLNNPSDDFSGDFMHTGGFLVI